MQKIKCGAPAIIIILILYVVKLKFFRSSFFTKIIFLRETRCGCPACPRLLAALVPHCVGKRRPILKILFCRDSFVYRQWFINGMVKGRKERDEYGSGRAYDCAVAVREYACIVRWLRPPFSLGLAVNPGKSHIQNWNNRSHTTVYITIIKWYDNDGNRRPSSMCRQKSSVSVVFPKPMWSYVISKWINVSGGVV